jgi:hypothetical protein
MSQKWLWLVRIHCSFVNFLLLGAFLTVHFWTIVYYWSTLLRIILNSYFVYFYKSLCGAFPFSLMQSWMCYYAMLDCKDCGTKDGWRWTALLLPKPASYGVGRADRSAPFPSRYVCVFALVCMHLELWFRRCIQWLICILASVNMHNRTS